MSRVALTCGPRHNQQVLNAMILGPVSTLYAIEEDRA